MGSGTWSKTADLFSAPRCLPPPPRQQARQQAQQPRQLPSRQQPRQLEHSRAQQPQFLSLTTHHYTTRLLQTQVMLRLVFTVLEFGLRSMLVFKLRIRPATTITFAYIEQMGFAFVASQ